MLGGDRRVHSLRGSGRRTALGSLRPCSCLVLLLSFFGERAGWRSFELVGREGKQKRREGYSSMQQWRISAPQHGAQDSFLFFFFLPCPLYSLCRLVHLAIIHCVPAVALCCIAHLPREVLEIQNDLFQVCGCDRWKMGGREVPQAAPWIDAQSIRPFPGTPPPIIPSERGEGPV